MTNCEVGLTIVRRWRTSPHAPPATVIASEGPANAGRAKQSPSAKCVRQDLSTKQWNGEGPVTVLCFAARCITSLHAHLAAWRGATGLFASSPANAHKPDALRAFRFYPWPGHNFAKVLYSVLRWEFGRNPVNLLRRKWWPKKKYTQ